MKPHESPRIRKKSIRGDSGDSWPVWNRGIMVTCWERADLLALVCEVSLSVCHFPIGILSQVWSLIVSIPDLTILNVAAF